ncbi:A/G-specific adenine glycosylase/endonuclease III, putative [Talaromyces stipitatus ATCC 10500]|uniref:Endonuclease III homolog n=1 Tax=Talaromyces stipitatus (strain ATCC 10500 / CBS 375.48 / QM 6759 / NRRL 1006) TaxID=441959 RepID=B8MSJ7_TALSN|nr:A/G-specific adenine glycosylase/endonuclease III, putative [Talaromyces stipitatus ATCC 10500]EED12077.1 A/G-specific adenine glycosylase/endonuclease III, putative [Talaromyces stipitatus ATCC 10500]
MSLLIVNPQNKHHIRENISAEPKPTFWSQDCHLLRTSVIFCHYIVHHGYRETRPKSSEHYRPRRQTRSSLAASTQRNSQKAPEFSDDAFLPSANTEDIEDLLERPTKRRRRNNDPLTTTASTVTTSTLVREEVTIRAEIRDDGFIETQPPSNWEIIYDIVKKMRTANPTALVDTMGCAELHWRASSPKDQRFQTLIALMLSSQTKDTVTAVAMQRLHTELGEGEQPNNPSPSKTLIKKEENDADSIKVALEKKPSTLTVQNVLAVSPERLNELIRSVGFHNNKTKYIKQVAIILRDKYESDIPPTPEELMALPGVGPKMAYLCMSAAWGKYLGIGVDVHVHRITNLWGWHATKTPEETRIALQLWLPRDKWHEINKLLIGLGQTACLPVGRRCGECDLAGTGLCKSEIKGLVAKTKREVKEEAKVKIELHSLRFFQVLCIRDK